MSLSPRVARRLLLGFILVVGASAAVVWSAPPAVAGEMMATCCRGACDCQVKDGCCPDTQCQEDGSCL